MNIENMDWDNPQQRLALIERVGSVEYNKLINDFFTASTIKIVNGYRIRPITTRYGRLYAVHGTTSAFSTAIEAEAYAKKLTTGGVGVGEPIYAVIMWVIKNANLYIDSQLLETYELMVAKCNVVLYKSNQRDYRGKCDH